jgi:hypothetical protein
LINLYEWYWWSDNEKIICSWIYKPCHDKTNIMGLRPAWIQTSLRIRAVWSGSMLFAISFFTCYRVCKRTAWIHAGRKPVMLVLSWRGSIMIYFTMLWCHCDWGDNHRQNVILFHCEVKTTCKAKKRKHRKYFNLSKVFILVTCLINFHNII